MANPLVHYIADGSNFDGAANNAAHTSGGLFTFDSVGLANNGERRVWPYVSFISLQILGTTPVVTGYQWAIIDRTIGNLPYDTQTANFTVGQTASATGLTSAIIVDDDDAGATGDLLLNTIVGNVANNVADLVDDGGTPGAATTNCAADSSNYEPEGIRFSKRVIHTGSSLTFHQTFQGPGFNGAMPELPIFPEASGSSFEALRLVSVGMSTSFAIAKVGFGYFAPKSVGL